MDATRDKPTDSIWDRPTRTEFPGIAAWLGALLTGASLDTESLAAPMNICDLAECKGACCCNGAHLEADEAEVLTQLVRSAGNELHELGAHVHAATHADDRAVPRLGSRKTAVRRLDAESGGSGTACVFWLHDGRCALQVFAEKSGRHPWAYKPVACWLHPLDIIVKPEGTTVALFRGHPPPPGSPPSVGSAPCSQRSSCGSPALELLGGELHFLSGISGWLP